MSLRRLFATGLPMNRKERFFTGTVFPMIVCCEDMAHVDRLLATVGVGAVDIDGRPGSTNLQLFTEYGFTESVVGAASDRFDTAGLSRATPDIVIHLAGPVGRLLLIEAKMYDRPTATDLVAQIEGQKGIGVVMADGLGLDANHVVSVALLPQRLADEIGPIGDIAVLTWEDLRELYLDVAPAYWLEVLNQALADYELLAGAAVTFGANADATLSGQAIYDGYHAGDLPYLTMGRQGGLTGGSLATDLSSGAWKQRPYECRIAAEPVNTNWFTVTEFVEAVHASL